MIGIILDHSPIPYVVQHQTKDKPTILDTPIDGNPLISHELLTIINQY